MCFFIRGSFFEDMFLYAIMDEACSATCFVHDGEDGFRFNAHNTYMNMP